MDWTLKKDDEGHVVFQDDKPVYIDPDGKEIALDAPQMYVKIIDLGKESKKHREKADALGTQLSLFEGIDDLPAWKVEADKAIDTTKNLKDGDWLKAEKVEALKKDMKSAYDERETSLTRSFTAKEDDYKLNISKKDSQIRTLMVTNKFATSPYFSGTEPKTNLPPEIAETYFGKNFKVEEDGKTGKLALVAYYDNGDPVLSRQRPGEIAEFDEAMTAIFDAYPGKERLLKAGGSGSGGGGGGGGHEDETDEIKKLEKDYADAAHPTTGDVKKAIILKNRLFDLKKKARTGGA